MATKQKLIKIEVTAYKLCPECGNYLANSLDNANVKFCNSCGTHLLECCPNCREEITSPISRFCSACGTPLRYTENLEKTLPSLNLGL